MKSNIGNSDKVLRYVAAALLIGVSFLNVISGTAEIILLVIATVLILTTLTGFCPLYYPFGITTKKK